MKTNRDKNLDDKLKNIKFGSSKAKISKIFEFKKEGTTGIVNALTVDINLIIPNPNQPRKYFKKETLQELSDSIKERGVLQPIRVRPKDKKYEIIAGERRWQASQLANLKKIPCIVIEQDDQATYIDALMENIQREDLNPIDRANGLEDLKVHLGGLSWEEVGKKLGLKRSHVFNLLGLKSLPDNIQADIKNGIITEKHGRALKTLINDQVKFEEAYQKFITERMTGEEALNFARSLKRSQKPNNQKAYNQLKSASKKYQDLLIISDFAKFDNQQKIEFKTELLKIIEVANRTVEKLS